MKREVRWVHGVIGAAARAGVHSTGSRTVELSRDDLEVLEWLRMYVTATAIEPEPIARRALAVLARLTTAV